MRILILLAAIWPSLLFAQQVDLTADPQLVLKGDYLGQVPPGQAGQLFAPKFVSTQFHELNAVSVASGKEFYFSRRGVPGKESSIMVSRLENGQWTSPKALEFGSRYSAIDLFVTADGLNLIYCSNRPREVGGTPRNDHDFWISCRTDDGWGAPELFAIEALSDHEDFFPILTRSGTLYFNSQREGTGTNNIYRSRFVDGRYTPAEKLPEPVNSSSREFDAWVSPDESLIVFASERPGGLGGSDLYATFLEEDGAWTPPENLGEGINTSEWEYGIRPSPDGKYLFYTSSQGANENIYWVSAEVIDTIRKRI